MVRRTAGTARGTLPGADPGPPRARRAAGTRPRGARPRTRRTVTRCRRSATATRRARAGGRTGRPAPLRGQIHGCRRVTPGASGPGGAAAVLADTPGERRDTRMSPARLRDLRDPSGPPRPPAGTARHLTTGTRRPAIDTTRKTTSTARLRRTGAGPGSRQAERAPGAQDPQTATLSRLTGIRHRETHGAGPDRHQRTGSRNCLTTGTAAPDTTMTMAGVPAAARPGARREPRRGVAGAALPL